MRLVILYSSLFFPVDDVIHITSRTKYIYAMHILREVLTLQLYFLPLFYQSTTLAYGYIAVAVAVGTFHNVKKTVELSLVVTLEEQVAAASLCIEGLEEKRIDKYGVFLREVLTPQLMYRISLIEFCT